MKKICYALYGLWIVSAVVLKILGLASTWAATSWLWFPLAMALSVFMMIDISVNVGRMLQKREESKIPDSCETCLFGQTAKYAENGKCLGETIDENSHMGALCPSYKRNIQR